MDKKDKGRNKVMKEVSERTLVKVYSFGDNCWRQIQSFPFLPITQQTAAKFLSGTFNWLALRNYSSDYDWDTVTIDQLLIVSLDLGKETYTQVLLPHGFDELPHVEPNVGVLMDCLCFSHDYKRTQFVIWQVKEIGVEKSWTQLVNVSYVDLQLDCFKYHFMLPFCMSEDGDVLLIADSKESQAILYNRRDSRVERTIISNWFFVQDYVQRSVSTC